MTAKRRTTISDVAGRAGVSKATVSAVLNGKGTVRSSTQSRVIAAMRELDYHPRSTAGLPTRGDVRSLGLLIKELDNPYYWEIVTGILEFGRSHGYAVVVASSEGDVNAEQEATAMLRRQGVAGLLVTPVGHRNSDHSHLIELDCHNLPYVLLEPASGVQASLVDVENVSASRQAVEFLIEQGHERIVHFAGPSYSAHTAERIEGVRRAFERRSLTLPDNGIVDVGAHLEDGYRVGLAYFRGLAEEDRPTAVTCYNDLVAMGLIRALYELGIRVPEEVSVVGFDDLKMLSYMGIALTTVHVPKMLMGERATEILIRRVEASGVEPPERVYFEGKLIVRSSTRSLNA